MTMKITTAAQHAAALNEFNRLADDEAANHEELLVLRDAISAYEQAAGHVHERPKTLRGLLELEMYRRRLKQKSLAVMLEIPESRLSEILRGKTKPSLTLVKTIHRKLHIPAEELLSVD